MPNPTLDKITQAVKSLYQLENELRSAVINGAIQRREAASKHLAEARRHLEDILSEAKQEAVNPPEPTCLDAAAPKKEGDI